LRTAVSERPPSLSTPQQATETTRGVASPVIAPSGFDLRGESTSLRLLVRKTVESRTLLVMLARKDFFVRYRRASFGLIWAVALPLVQAVVLAVVFSHVLRIRTATNYPAFVYSGIVPWIFFSTTLSAASTSIVDGQDMATKVYFPRAILPLVPIGSAIYGYVPAVIILVGIALLGHVHLGLNWLLLLPATALMVLLTATFSLVLAALHVYFRDVRYLVTAALTVWIYLAPILYPLKWAPNFLRHIIAVVPTTGMVELFRAGSVGADPGWVSSLVVTAVWAVALTAAAALLYRRYDRVFVDLL
jgi:ABC-type polysaccharide/polyol phosphate export permease